MHVIIDATDGIPTLTASALSPTLWRVTDHMNNRTWECTDAAIRASNPTWVRTLPPGYSAQ